MSRQFRATRPGLTPSDDVQRQIDYLPSMISCFRKGDGDGLHVSKGSLSFVGSFQGLLTLHERISKSMIDLKEPYGAISKSVYILITKESTDIYGNTIDVQQGDILVDNNYSYLVDSIVNFSFKNEAILEYLQ